jgi:hypothetical protein
MYDALRTHFMMLQINHDPQCRYCGDHGHFPGYVDYAALCATSHA